MYKGNKMLIFSKNESWHKHKWIILRNIHIIPTQEMWSGKPRPFLFIVYSAFI
jgi:hypothetical protein